MPLPNDPIMLLSVINTKLRDYYPNLLDLSKSLDVNIEEIEEKISKIGYKYSPERNQFIPK